MDNSRFFSLHFSRFYHRLRQLKKFLKRELNIWQFFSFVMMPAVYLLLSSFILPTQKTIIKYFGNGMLIVSGLLFFISLPMKKTAEMLPPMMLLFALGLLFYFDFFHCGISPCVLAVPFLVFACRLFIPTIASVRKNETDR